MLFRSLVDGMTLFKPNEGTLYPVNYDLAERSLAAAKTVRTFPQLQQHGYRCSLCGEREWLTHDRELLSHYPNKGDKLRIASGLSLEKSSRVGHARGSTSVVSVRSNESGQAALQRR